MVDDETIQQSHNAHGYDHHALQKVCAEDGEDLGSVGFGLGAAAAGNGKCSGHHALDFRDIGVEVVTEYGGQGYGADDGEEGGQSHDNKHGHGEIFFQAQSGPEDEAEKGGGQGIEDGGHGPEKEGDKGHAEEYGKAALYVILGGVGHHGNGKKIDKESLEKACRLPVDDEQNGK